MDALLIETDHMRGYVAFGRSERIPKDASEEFKAGYSAHRWEQVAYLCNRSTPYTGEDRRKP